MEESADYLLLLLGYEEKPKESSIFARIMNIFVSV
jgi:hypothetical protein